MISFIRSIATIVVTATLAVTLAATASAETIDEPACCHVGTGTDQHAHQQIQITDDALQPRDRIWLISTRCLPTDVCQIDLANPPLSLYRVDGGVCEPSSLEAFETRSDVLRPMAVYVHGNRINMQDNVCRGTDIYRSIKQCRDNRPIDWVIWSWPASKERGHLMKDFREKAERTDGQGLYLAWFLRRQVQASTPISIIGYSFGARVITGSLHALAGGRLDGRSLAGPAITGASISAGLLAPAIDANWMCPQGYHGRATKNLKQLVLMYSGRDAILKRYWLIDRIRNSVALGYSGPQAFGLRADGTRLPVRSRDCASVLGIKHVEIDYYSDDRCNAQAEMASVIHASIQNECN